MAESVIPNSPLAMIFFQRVCLTTNHKFSWTSDFHCQRMLKTLGRKPLFIHSVSRKQVYIWYLHELYKSLVKLQWYGFNDWNRRIPRGSVVTERPQKKKCPTRPTFQYKNNPVRAAGILIYTVQGHRVLRLFRKIKGRFEDIGGKTDKDDTNEVETAVRECVEETHGKLFDARHTPEECANILRELITTNCETEYNKKSKYLLFKLQVHPGIIGATNEAFWIEGNDGLGRTRPLLPVENGYALETTSRDYLECDYKRLYFYVTKYVFIDGWLPSMLSYNHPLYCFNLCDSIL